MKWVLWVAVLPVAAVLDAVSAATGRPAAHPNEGMGRLKPGRKRQGGLVVRETGNDRQAGALHSDRYPPTDVRGPWL
jgi:hypothetical protein